MHLAGSNMILKEAPRLYSPQIRLNRRTCKTVKLGGITYPKGMSVIMAISSFTMIQNSWATMPKNSIQRGLQVGCQRIRWPSFLFSWGSRVCMGQNFAMSLSMFLQLTVTPYFSKYTKFGAWQESATYFQKKIR